MTKQKPTETPPAQPIDIQATSSQEITQSAPVSLPSPHLLHENTLLRELTNRLSQFDTALEVVIAEKEGRILRHEQQLAELTEKHDLGISELDRQAKDIDKGRKRLLRALEEEAEE